MANLYLSSGDNLSGLTFGGGVFGAAGSETVSYTANATGITVDQNVEEVRLAGSTSSYTYQQQGNQLVVRSGTTVVATITLQNDTNGTLITFANGRVEAKVSAAGMTLGGTTVPSAAASAVVPTTIDSSITSVPQVLALTTGVDAIVGTSGDDTISATQLTLTALDTIDGGAGNDTLNVVDASGAAYSFPASIDVKNVETVNVKTAAAAITADVQAFAGLKTVNAEVVGTDAAVTVTTKGNVTAASATGSTSATFTDNGTTNTLASVTVTDATGAVTADSDALTSLTLKNTSGAATVTAAAATRALALTLNGVTAGAITDATATTLNITTTGAASTPTSITAGAATSVTVAADEKLTTALTAAAATSLTVTGDSLVTLTAGDISAVTAVDSSAQTAGGLDIDSFTLGNAVSFVGGAGADSIKLGATTKAITLGAGNDTVLLAAGTTALGTGGSIDGGAGTGDTIAFADADDAGTASATAAAVSNFEVVELAGAAGAAVAVNLANLGGSSNLKLSADVGQALTVTKFANNGTLTVTATQTGATSLALTDATGTADAVNVAIAGAAAVGTGALTIAGVETVNYLTDDTATTPTGIQHTSNLTATAVKTITVAGDAGLALTNTDTTVTTFDASAVTKGAVSWTTGALANVATVTGGAGNDSLIATASTKAVTLNGGAGDDTLTAANALNNTVNGGDGIDTITTGSGADVINGGAGNDIINSGTGLDVLTGGAGNDQFAVTVNVNGNTYATVTDAAKGDSFLFADQGTETFASARISLAGTAVFQDYLDAATAGDGAANGAFGWFQFAGDTYLVQDNSTQATFQNGADIVIKLTGLIDLSTATGGTTNIVTIA